MGSRIFDEFFAEVFQFMLASSFLQQKIVPAPKNTPKNHFSSVLASGVQVHQQHRTTWFFRVV